jgi:nucleotide-binding universal stress UspA family protein
MIPKTIMVGTDFSAAACDAADWAVEVARAFDARVVLVHAVGTPRVGVRDASFDFASEGRGQPPADPAVALEVEVDRARRHGVVVEGRLVHGDPLDALLPVAREIGAGLLVVGSHRRSGMSIAHFGSVAEAVLRSAHVPVTVLRHGP